MQKQVALKLDCIMKILLALVLSVILVGSIFEDSYGLESQKKPTTKIFFFQELRDKDGNLIGYIQPVLQIFDKDRTIAWIAQHGTNSTVVYNGQNYLLMKYDEPLIGSQFDQFGGYFLKLPVNGKTKQIFYAYYDSYFMNTGDNNRAYWEALVPLQ